MPKIGLVLSGGGGKGAYQIGVWRALHEYGIDQKITAISGTSVGALNAALFLQGNYQQAEDVWLHISPEKILTVDLRKIATKLMQFNYFNKMPNLVGWLNSHGWFSRTGLLEIIRRDVNLPLVSQSRIPFFATCFNEKTWKANYFQLNDRSPEHIESVLLATSAIPVIFDPVTIGGVTYWDGGLVDNVPIQPLYDLGCEYIIAVHLRRDHPIDYSRFPKAQIFEIVPQEDQGNLIKGTLNFSPRDAAGKMEQGYEDAVAILQPLFKMIGTQKKLWQRINQLGSEEAQFRERRDVFYRERNNLKEELTNYLKE